MKIAIISDIHANYDYLNAVIKELEKCDIVQMFCLGDIVGYYDQPNEVIDLMKERNVISIKGNHEKYLLNELTYDHSKENIYRINTQKEILTQKNYNYLKNLPDEISLELAGKRFYMTHSLPNDSTSYIYDLKKISKETLNHYDYYCFGHTHIPIISYQYGTCILNPGSIGQPRDYTRKPSFIIVDLKEDLVTLKKIHIEYLRYSQKLKTLNFDDTLITILKREKNEKS